MKTLSSFSVQNGAITEQYTVVVDASGETFLQCCADADNAGPVDTMHIDRHALVPIARALLMATIQRPVRTVMDIPAPVGNVVPFRVIA